MREYEGESEMEERRDEDDRGCTDRHGVCSEIEQGSKARKEGMSITALKIEIATSGVDNMCLSCMLIGKVTLWAGHWLSRFGSISGRL